MRHVYPMFKVRGLAWWPLWSALAVCVFAFARASFGLCWVNCFAGASFYNDYYNDWETSQPVCVTFARLNTDLRQQNGVCAGSKEMQRWRLLNAVRYCGAHAQRGENKPGGTRQGSTNYLERWVCGPY